jgi:methyl-accepting chemotaxis protein
MSNDPMPDAKMLRNRVFARLAATSLPSTVVVAYLISLTLDVDSDELGRSLALVLAPLLVASSVLLFVWVSIMTRRALAPSPDGGESGRLQRLLELPRKIEVYPYLLWAVVGGTYASISCALYGGSFAVIPFDVLIALFAALFLGPLLTLSVEDVIRPVALDEFRQHPKVKLRTRGSIFWIRQRWYLPYAFAVALASFMVFSGTVVVTRYGQALEQLRQVLRAEGLGWASTPIEHDLQEMAVNAGIPVLILAGVLFAAFGITGWMLARRQARAAEALEHALRAIAAGTPEIPGWVASDETGDLSLATAGVSSEMHHVFDQLRAMAAGDLSQELQGESGLIAAFRESQSAMLQLARMMIALSKGEMSGDSARIPGDLGAHFDQLQGAFRAIVDQAQTIAQGDLRKDVDVPGALGQAIQQMTSNLRSMVGQTQSVSGNIGDIVVSLQSASSQLSTATTEQVAAVTETANTMTEMAQTSAVSADRASDLIKQGEAAAQVVEEGLSAAESAVSAIGAIAESLGKVSSASSSLAERVQRIDSITETVGFLADQSSTLAINAAIEAARAGEAGKGFAVVAREIRGLASDSRKAASQIREILVEIRERTSQVDGSVVAGTRTVEDGKKLVDKLGEVVNQLGVTVHDAVGLMRQVEGSARQHQAGVGQVSQALTNMQRASESIRDGARLLGDLSSKAHELSAALQKASGAYALPTASA